MKDEITLKTKGKKRQTTIYMGFDLIQGVSLLNFCKNLSERLAIITDTEVGKYYSQPLLECLQQADLDVTLHTFQAGEKSKSRFVKARLEDELFEAGHGRASACLAMGGGVTTDLVGYLAATFCRGISYLSLPTSLLAMVDASIGGKTGVNLSYGKNLIGALHHPSAIFIDLSTLQTLSDDGMREGGAEIIKKGLIANSNLFEMLDENLEKWHERDLLFLKELVYESCLVKKKIVEVDPEEKGIRRILNFGHTIGHALEVLEGYEMPHGEAVAIGMLVESFMSLNLKKITQIEFDQIYRLLHVMGYRLKISSYITSEKMMEVMRYDKKAKNAMPRFVLLNGIGKAASFKKVYCAPVDEMVLSEALGWMMREFQKDVNDPLSD